VRCNGLAHCLAPPAAARPPRTLPGPAGGCPPAPHIAWPRRRLPARPAHCLAPPAAARLLIANLHQPYARARDSPAHAAAEIVSELASAAEIVCETVFVCAARVLVAMAAAMVAPAPTVVLECCAYYHLARADACARSPLPTPPTPRSPPRPPSGLRAARQ
jgi:hypothetical protein